MKLKFNLEYQTSWGQDVRVEIIIKRKSGSDLIYTNILNTEDGINWNGEIMLHEKDAKSFCYSYFIGEGDNIVRKEWSSVPRLFPYSHDKTFILQDYWKDIPPLSHLYSSAYSHCVAHSIAQEPEINYYDRTLLFRVQAPQLKKGQALALLGSLPQLGEWMPQRAMCMSRGGTHEWCLTLSATGLQFPFEYKYVVVEESTGELISWEGGENRVSPKIEGQNPENTSFGLPATHTSTKENMLLPANHIQVIWDRRLRMIDEHWKTAGVVIPVFSLKSENSQGVGDFGDLHKLVDWANKTGMRVIQLLPIYDTTQTATWTDCYPYNAISIYALHPIYMDLKQLPPIKDNDFMQKFEQSRCQLNALAQMDYEGALNLKMDYLHRLYEQEGENILASGGYKTFLKKNDEWLVSYSVFCHRRDMDNTSYFPAWKELSVYDEKEVRNYASANSKEVNFYSFVQYLLSLQLSSVTDYARNNGVLLKGDIPIGISRTSVEAWTEPEYFNINGSAGAPPDEFSADGQNWGFPTYNWKRMQKDGNIWWIKRFRKMAEYFDAYRIDHVLGFFRIWEIPLSARSGLLGHFEPCLPMSTEEIEKEGLKWREKFFTTPYITDNFLRSLLNNQADIDEIRSTFLEAVGPDWYVLRNEFTTENQIHEYFGNIDDNPRLLQIRSALCKLVQNILFIPLNEGFVPRISAQKTYIYDSLSSSEQEAFNRIYEHFYYYRHNDFWATEAMKKLPALVESTQMLCCAEDLGMVPACVGPVMNQLRILSLEIQTMPKQYGVRFGQLENNPYMSVVTIFTHDMPTLRLWWKENEDNRQHFYNEALQKDGKAPDVMPGWLCEEVIARHLFSPSMLCLISLQDWLSMDESLRAENIEQERINIPSNPNHYWRYRMHLNIEDLMDANEFNNKIKVLIERSGRG